MQGGEDRVGAALVPGDLGDVAAGRGLGGGVISGVPVGGAAVRHVEVGAADRDVVRCTAEAVDGDAVARTLHSCAVATRGPGISSSDEHCDALRRGLLPEALVEGIAGGSEEELALAVAVTHHGREIVVDDVDGGQVGALRNLSGLANHVIDGRTLGYGRGPLRVDVGFALVGGHAGVGTVIDNVEVLRAGWGRGVAELKVEYLPEVNKVGGIDVGLTNDGDGLPGAVDRRGGAPKRHDVVDGSEIIGREAVGGFAAIGEGECRGLAGVCRMLEVRRLVISGATRKVVERGYARDDRS